MKVKVRCNKAEDCPHDRYGSSHPGYCEHHDVHEVDGHCYGAEWCLEYGNCTAGVECIPIMDSDIDS